jgi:transporter family-2 protein
MLSTIFVILAGLLGGVAVGVQAPIAGVMGQRIGGAASSFIVHVSGAILSGIMLVAVGGEKIRDWHTLPWYMLASGIFGLILYQTINITLPRLGATAMVGLIIVGQLLTGLLLDYFGWLGVAQRAVDPTRLIGVAVLLVGGYLVVR